MPSPKKPDVPKAATPRYGPSFDPWNSSSTGHQRAENRLGGSTGWRNSRSAKLQSQFKGGATGGERRSDAVGAGSLYWDSDARTVIPPESRARARNSVMDMLAKPGTMKQSMINISRGDPSAPVGREPGDLSKEEISTAQSYAESQAQQGSRHRQRKIFEGVVIYINGSTHPTISDHKLKHVLAEHGARLSIHLGRRQVTHVILGRSAGAGGGAGGGLAGGKLQREIQQVGGSVVKYVGVEWILESIKAGKRLPEARFSNLKIAPKGQRSVFKTASTGRTSAISKDEASSDQQFQASRSNTLLLKDDEPPPSGQRPGPL